MDEEEDVLSSSSSSQEGNEVLGEGYDDPNDLNPPHQSPNQHANNQQETAQVRTIQVDGWIRKLITKRILASDTIATTKELFQ